MIAGVINGHVAAKYVYVRLFRGTDRMQKRTFLSVGSWVGISFVLWVVAWVIAEAIPVFNNLLSLIVSPRHLIGRARRKSADAIWYRLLFSRAGSPVSTIIFANFMGLDSHPRADGLSGIFWLFLNWGRYGSSPRKICLTIINLLIVGIGGCLCGMGLWVSGKAIHGQGGGSSFSCTASTA